MTRLLLIAALLAASPTAAGAPGDRAPERRFDDLQGRPRPLLEEGDRIVVVNFWATWCLPCLEEMSLLSEVYSRYGGRGVRVVGVSADGPGTRDRVADFARVNDIEFDVRVGGTIEDMQRFGLGEALPATAILDRDGTVAFRIAGPVERGDLETRIEWLLGPRAVPAPVEDLDRFSGHDDAHDHGEAETRETHDHAVDHGHHHDGEEEHRHGAIDVEGASLVPS